MRLRLTSLFFPVVMAVGGLSGCAARQNTITYSRGEARHVVLSWRDYDGTSDPDEALYLLDGKEMGRGLRGVIRTLSEFDHLPPGTVVDVHTGFPTYEPSGPNRRLPYDEAFEEFHAFARSRGITIND